MKALIIILLSLGITMIILGGYKFLTSFEPDISEGKINSRSKFGKILFLTGNACIITGIVLKIYFGIYIL